MISTLKSELAALQFKRDRLMSEVSKIVRLNFAVSSDNSNTEESKIKIPRYLLKKGYAI